MGIPGSPAIPGWGEPNVVDDIVLVLYADPEDPEDGSAPDNSSTRTI